MVCTLLLCLTLHLPFLVPAPVFVTVTAFPGLDGVARFLRVHIATVGSLRDGFIVQLQRTPLLKEKFGLKLQIERNLVVLHQLLVAKVLRHEGVGGQRLGYLLHL